MTRLTDKEREAVAYFDGGKPTDRLRGDCELTEEYGSILASCVTRLDAPVGGLETVGWVTNDLDRCVPAHTMEGAKKDGGAILSGLSKFTEPCVLRSTAEAKIAGLAEALRGALESINLFRENVKDGTVARGVFEGYFTGVDAKIRALIETDGGEG